MPFKPVPSETLERVARAMCKADHNDPDRRVARFNMPYLCGIAQHKMYVPTEQHTMCAWELYAHLVPAAIEALGLNVVSTQAIIDKYSDYTPPILSRTHDQDEPGVIVEDEPESFKRWLRLNLPTRVENEAKRNVDYLALNKAMS